GQKKNQIKSDNFRRIKMQITIVLAGPRGKMGQEAIKMMEKEERFQLVGCIDRLHDGKKLSDIGIETEKDVPIFTDAAACFKATEPDVFVDLTLPQVGYTNTSTAIEHHIHSVVGTSGFSKEQIDVLGKKAREEETGCLIAPNFALGAVLM